MCKYILEGEQKRFLKETSNIIDNEFEQNEQFLKDYNLRDKKLRIANIDCKEELLGEVTEILDNVFNSIFRLQQDATTEMPNEIVQWVGRPTSGSHEAVRAYA